jgi:hypothetical protein
MPKPESTFYNVMPEAKINKVAPPTAPKPNPNQAPVRKVNAAAASTVFTAGPATSTVTMDRPAGRSGGFFRRRAVIIPAGIILLGIIGFAAWFFMFASKDSVNVNNNTQVVNEPIQEPDTTTPADWLARYFGSETCTVKNQCSDSADPDRDGLTNKEEYENGADPNNPDSDSDGIADGDELHIFNSDPLIARSFRDGEYNDADFVKGSYDIRTNLPYTPEQLAEIKSKVKERGLHQPTLTTIGPLAISIYDFEDPTAQPLENLNIDQSPQAKLDRDTQRQATVKKIGGALLKYKEAKNSFPLGTDFVAMSDAIGPYNTVATNYNDPINKEQYVYAYDGAASGGDFTITYYSETQNQLIKYTSKNALENFNKENAQVNNDQRIADLENVKSALFIYSQTNVDSNSEQINVFPTKEQFPSVLIPRYISAMPKDPNGQDYVYEVGPTFDTFTLKAVFQNPPAGVTGYMCNQDECRNY